MAAGIHENGDVTKQKGISRGGISLYQKFSGSRFHKYTTKSLTCIKTGELLLYYQHITEGSLQLVDAEHQRPCQF